MSEAKPTAGPWDYIGDHIVGVLGECDCEPSETHLAGVVYPDRLHESHEVVKPIIEDDLPEGVTIETHIANCRLIAAATDLLHACEAALNGLEYATNSHPQTTGKAQRAEAIDLLRAALAKARGE